MKILFVGGGSGGHFYPLMAVAESIRATTGNTHELYFVGPDPHSQSDLDALNITYVYCPAGKVRRYMSLQNVIDIFRTIGGIFVMWYKLFVLYPDVIFSKGSYTSVPVLLMARFYRIPVVIHESDSKAGRANLFARKFATYIGITYPESASYFPGNKTALVGIPIRQQILTPQPDPWGMLGIPNDAPLIYVTGGSLGAERINALILQSLPALLPQYRVFHQTGPTAAATVTQTAQALLADNPELLSRYYVAGLLPAEAVAALLQVSALVISRAGSTSLYEIALRGRPSIIIPIPEEISHDQRTNAYSYARTGAASVLEEGNLTPHLLVTEIQSIMTDQAKYARMQQGTAEFANPNAATLITEALLRIGYEHGS